MSHEEFVNTLRLIGACGGWAFLIVLLLIVVHYVVNDFAGLLRKHNIFRR